MPWMPRNDLLDPAERRARWAVTRDHKDGARRKAKANGHKLGHWVGGGAACKRPGCGAFARLDGLPADEPRDATAVPCKGGQS